MKQKICQEKRLNVKHGAELKIFLYHEQKIIILLFYTTVRFFLPAWLIDSFDYPSLSVSNSLT